MKISVITTIYNHVYYLHYASDVAPRTPRCYLIRGARTFSVAQGRSPVANLLVSLCGCGLLGLLLLDPHVLGVSLLLEPHLHFQLLAL